jgi:Xaa-Pro aminopeptidase
MRRALQLLTILMLAAAAPLAAQITPEEYASRRADLARRAGDGVVVVLGSGGTTAGDLALQYVTGAQRADAALVLSSRAGGHHEMLFGDAGGAEGLPVRPVAALAAAVDSLLRVHGALTVIGGFDPDARGAGQATLAFAAGRAAHPSVDVRQGGGLISQMRAIKSPAELELIRRAVAITAEAHRAVLGNLRPGINEAEISAIVDATFREHGGDERPAFRNIVASASNSTILHYNQNNRIIADGEHVKVDIGAAYQGYAADVTRTYPANGVFSPAQREIYQVVRDAQAAAEAVAVPGAARADMPRAADRALGEGLTRLGLMEAPDATYDCQSRDGQISQCPQLRLFYFHGLGHGLGLNVHDQWPDRLVPGTAFVIEPGIYVRTNVLELIADTPRNRAYIARIRPALDRYLGIGVRIEDSYLITETGLEHLSRVPRDLADVEAAMAAAATARNH